MCAADWARDLARSQLATSLPRRWAHSQGVAAGAREIASCLGSDSELVEAAAWLHDIGYSPGLVTHDFHPLDGALYLRDVAHADPLICRLVAFHSGADVEADERGIAGLLFESFQPPPRRLLRALTYCDMTTGPDGKRMSIDERLSDIRARYGSDSIVTRSIDRAEPMLRQATDAVTQTLAGVDLSIEVRTRQA